ncbi:MAG: hypothetical protein AAFN07_11330, partial [Pseudomonadota bacterium]
ESVPDIVVLFWERQALFVAVGSEQAQLHALGRARIQGEVYAPVDDGGAKAGWVAFLDHFDSCKGARRQMSAL